MSNTNKNVEEKLDSLNMSLKDISELLKEILFQNKQKEEMNHEYCINPEARERCKKDAHKLLCEQCEKEAEEEVSIEPGEEGEYLDDYKYDEDLMDLDVENAIDYEDLVGDAVIKDTAEQILSIIFDVIHENISMDDNVVEFDMETEFAEELCVLTEDDMEKVFKKCRDFLELYGYNCKMFVKGDETILRIVL
jgi:hypothetical protein